MAGLVAPVSPGPFQIKVFPVLVAINELAVAIQLIEFVLDAVNTGDTVSAFTCTVWIAVQLLPGSVTIKV